MFVDGSGAQRWPDIVADKFGAQVFGVDGRRAGGERLLARGFQIFLLANVADHGDYFAAVVFTEPGNNDGGIQSARIGQDDFFWFLLLLIHSVFSPWLSQ